MIGQPKVWTHFGFGNSGNLSRCSGCVWQMKNIRVFDLFFPWLLFIVIHAFLSEEVGVQKNCET